MYGPTVHSDQSMEVIRGHTGWQINFLCYLYMYVQRKKTLLQEYKRCSKSNLFVDHRFSEHGGETTLQERQLKRFIEKKVGFLCDCDT